MEVLRGLLSYKQTFLVVKKKKKGGPSQSPSHLCPSQGEAWWTVDWSCLSKGHPQGFPQEELKKLFLEGTPPF